MMRKATMFVVLLGCVACGASPEEPTETGATTPPSSTALAGSPAPSLPTSPTAPAPTGAAPAAPTKPASPSPSQNPGVAMPTAPTAPTAPTTPSTPTTTPTTPTTAPTTPSTAPSSPTGAGDEPKLAMDECGLDTQWDGDEYCINPPPADKGFQLHIGPSNYENPGSEYILQPGEENVVTMTATSGNTEQKYYYYRQYRMRPGSHHVIVSAGGVGGRRLGGTQNLAKDNPDFGKIAPENEGVGLMMAPRTQLSVNMHYYNVGEKPIIREVWVNFWYKDAASVKEPASEIFSMTGVTAATAHSHVVVGATCNITGSGRILSMYGHRHNSNKRFTVYRTRGTQKDLLMEDYDPVHPAVYEFNTITQNPKADQANKVPGGWSGPLDLMAGDKIEFQCEILNNTDKNFTGANEANDDEMCILVGDSVGTQISPLCSANPAMRLN
jgi:hypothetical protein